MITLNDNGLYCPPANIYIDPWKPVDQAIITHAHADHAKWGMKKYLAHHQSREILKYRIGSDINLETLGYDRSITINGVKISLHPAGHIPGSAQVRLEYKGKVTVVTGDYKTENDGLSDPFEVVKCHTFVSECTFGLPIYKWEDQHKIYSDINHWWASNVKENRCSVVFAYSLGKAQRILCNLDLNTGSVFAHGAVWNTNEALILNGIKLPNAEKITADTPKADLKNALILAPPSAAGTPWLKKFSPYRTAICSGWMNIRGARRRRAADIGFVLSDHADWEGLNLVIKETGAEEIFLTHGYNEIFARYLTEHQYKASALQTLYRGESMDAGDD